MVWQDMTPIEALRMALDLEERAFKTYMDVVNHVTREETREVFKYLAGEEKKHQEVIKAEMEKPYYKKKSEEL